MPTPYDYKKVERIFKGVANHWRLRTLVLLKDEPELSVADISDKLKSNFKTTSEHIRKLSIAGLVMKRYEGATVRHKLTSRGESILKFCRILE